MPTTSIRCICPMCGKKHKRKIIWIGRGIPRKFCSICRQVAEHVDGAEPFAFNPPKPQYKE